MNKFLRFLGISISILIINCNPHLGKNQKLKNTGLDANNSMFSDQVMEEKLSKAIISIEKESPEEILTLIEEILEEELNNEGKKAFGFLRDICLNKDMQLFKPDLNVKQAKFNKFLLDSGINRIKKILTNVIATLDAQKEAKQAINNYNGIFKKDFKNNGVINNYENLIINAFEMYCDDDSSIYYHRTEYQTLYKDFYKSMTDKHIINYYNAIKKDIEDLEAYQNTAYSTGVKMIDGMGLLRRSSYFK
ncbi:hypothetical protein [Borrelia hermsii]|uniref:Uncharacterized protein n=1 Tax=Borrelia hermsii MTW TaxID=1313291 RepID=W5T6V9_BORHE|nr:hypothetical protein [Borrelia hermsii]AHH14703.1 hypothetical protein BHW_0900049 [Borrelia hermsii MTW]